MISVSSVALVHLVLWHISPFLDDRFNETASAQGTEIESQQQDEWGHCGKGSSGTEGSFEVRIVDGTNDRIAEIYWECPHNGSNKLTKRKVKEGYDITFTGFSIPSGPLGNGQINVRED